MKFKKIIFIMLLVFCISSISSVFAEEKNSRDNLLINCSAVNRASNIRLNSVYDDAINSYLEGKDVGAVDLGDGNIKIPLDNKEYILIPIDNNLDTMIDKKDKEILLNSQFRAGAVSFNGEITKPGYPISNTVCAPKTGSLYHTFNLSSSFGYQISGSAGVDIEMFEASLGTTLSRTYTISESYKYKIPKNCCGTVYGSEIYKKYTYNNDTWYGSNKTATLLVPKRYLIYVIVK